MNKSQIFFIFGCHGNPQANNPMYFFHQRDRTFFKKSVLKILNKNINQQDKIVFIHEMVLNPERLQIPFDLKIDCLKNNKRGKNFSLSLRKWLIAERAMVTDTLQKYFYEGVNPSPEDWDWGFNEDLLKFSKNNKERILHLIEPADMHTIHLTFAGDLIFENLGKTNNQDPSYLKLWIQWYENLHQKIITRDKCLHDLVTGIVEKNPGIKIIIPRGMSHLGMKNLYNRPAIELILIRSKTVMTFCDHILTYPYDEKLSAKHITSNVMLELALLEKMKKLSFLKKIIIQNSGYFFKKYSQNYWKDKIIREVINENMNIYKDAWFNPLLPNPFAKD